MRIYAILKSGLFRNKIYQFRTQKQRECFAKTLRENNSSFVIYDIIEENLK